MERCRFYTAFVALNRPCQITYIVKQSLETYGGEGGVNTRWTETMYLIVLHTEPSYKNQHRIE